MNTSAIYFVLFIKYSSGAVIKNIIRSTIIAGKMISAAKNDFQKFSNVDWKY